MATPILTESERDEINELGDLIHAWAETHMLSVTEVLGRIEMVRLRIWNQHFHNAHLDPDPEGDEDDPDDFDEPE